MSKWTDKDTANYGNESLKDVARAEHQARDDAEKEGVFKRGDSDTNSKSFSKTDKAGESATGFWKSIFK